jgi:hypothetical protein
MVRLKLEAVVWRRTQAKHALHNLDEFFTREESSEVKDTANKDEGVLRKKENERKEAVKDMRNEAEGAVRREEDAMAITKRWPGEERLEEKYNHTVGGTQKVATMKRVLPSASSETVTARMAHAFTEGLTDDGEHADESARNVNEGDGSYKAESTLEAGWSVRGQTGRHGDKDGKNDEKVLRSEGVDEREKESEQLTMASLVAEAVAAAGMGDIGASAGGVSGWGGSEDDEEDPLREAVTTVETRGQTNPTSVGGAKEGVVGYENAQRLAKAGRRGAEQKSARDARANSQSRQSEKPTSTEPKSDGNLHAEVPMSRGLADSRERELHTPAFPPLTAGSSLSSRAGLTPATTSSPLPEESGTRIQLTLPASKWGDAARLFTAKVCLSHSEDCAVPHSINIRLSQVRVKRLSDIDPIAGVAVPWGQDSPRAGKGAEMPGKSILPLTYFNSPA